MVTTLNARARPLSLARSLVSLSLSLVSLKIGSLLLSAPREHDLEPSSFHDLILCALALLSNWLSSLNLWLVFE
jgi:hypothetical protein